jgi:hypothetical protein
MPCGRCPGPIRANVTTQFGGTATVILTTAKAYTPNMNCSLLVVNPSPRAVLVLGFSAFALRAGLDSLSIYSGAAPGAALVRTLTGTLPLGTTVTSSVGGVCRSG